MEQGYHIIQTFTVDNAYKINKAGVSCVLCVDCMNELLYKCTINDLSSASIIMSFLARSEDNLSFIRYSNKPISFTYGN